MDLQQFYIVLQLTECKVNALDLLKAYMLKISDKLTMAKKLTRNQMMEIAQIFSNWW
jgi:hypothetical protein